MKAFSPDVLPKNSGVTPPRHDFRLALPPPPCATPCQPGSFRASSGHWCPWLEAGPCDRGPCPEFPCLPAPYRWEPG